MLPSVMCRQDKYTYMITSLLVASIVFERKKKKKKKKMKKKIKKGREIKREIFYLLYLDYSSNNLRRHAKNTSNAILNATGIQRQCN